MIIKLENWREVTVHTFPYTDDLNSVTLETKLLGRPLLVSMHRTAMAGTASIDKIDILRMGPKCAYRYFFLNTPPMQFYLGRWYS
jgi:hypothetical protein